MNQVKHVSRRGVLLKSEMELFSMIWYQVSQVFLKLTLLWQIQAWRERLEKYNEAEAGCWSKG